MIYSLKNFLPEPMCLKRMLYRKCSFFYESQSQDPLPWKTIVFSLCKGSLPMYRIKHVGNSRVIVRFLFLGGYFCFLGF